MYENEEFNLTIYATDKHETTYIESRLIATTVPSAPPINLNPIVLELNPIYVHEV